MGKDLKEIQKEVDEMSKSLDHVDGFEEGTSAPSTKAAATAAPKTDSPSTTAPKTSAPSTDAPTTKSPSTKAPSTSAPTTEAPKEEDDEVKRLKEENEELRRKVAEKTPAKKPATKAPTTEAPPGEHDFVGERDIEELVRNPKEFNKFLNQIYAKAVVDARNMSSERVLRSIPDIVKTNIETVTSLKKASEKFYEDNKDLAPFKKVVAAVFEEVAAENPGKKFDQLLGDVAKESRKRLELSNQARQNQEPKNKPKTPTLPHKRGSQNRGNVPETKGIEAELDAMDKVLNS